MAWAPVASSTLGAVVFAAHELEYTKLVGRDSEGLFEVAPILQLGPDVYLVGVPASVFANRDAGHTCSLAVHADGDRSEWSAEYIDVAIRAVDAEAFRRCEDWELVDPESAGPFRYFEGDLGRWPFGDALVSVGLDSYAQFLGLSGADDLHEHFGFQVPDYGDDEEGLTSGIGPAIDVLTGAAIPEYSAQSGGEAPLGGALEAVAAPASSGAGAGGVGVQAPGLVGFPKPAGRGAVPKSGGTGGRPRQSIATLSAQIDVLVERLSRLEGVPPQVAGSRPPAGAPASAPGRGAGRGRCGIARPLPPPRPEPYLFGAVRPPGALPKVAALAPPARWPAAAPALVAQGGAFVPTPAGSLDRAAAVAAGRRLLRGETGPGRVAAATAWPVAAFDGAAGPEPWEASPAGAEASAAAAAPTLAGALADLAHALKESRGHRMGEYGLNVLPASTVEETETLFAGPGVQGGAAGVAAVERLRLTAEKRPDLVLLAFERSLRKSMGVLPGEAWTVHRHAREQVMPAAGNHAALKRTILILAHTLDLARTETPERAFAFVAQAYKAAHAAALHPTKEWKYGWPLLGLEEPDMPARVPYTPGENAALAAWHKDSLVIAKAMGTTSSGADAGDEPRRRGRGRGKGESAAPSGAKAGPDRRGPAGAGQ